MVMVSADTEIREFNDTRQDLLTDDGMLLDRVILFFSEFTLFVDDGVETPILPMS